MSPLPIPAPDPLPLPLPPGTLKALLLVTFTLHLMAVNLGVGGSLIAAVHAFRGKEEDRDLVRRLAPLLPASVTFAITLGVAPLLFVQLIYGPFFYTASVLTAVPWLALIFLLMAGYVLLYRFVGSVASHAFRAFSGILGALLLLGVGLALVNVTTLSLRPDLWAAHAAASPHGLRMNTADPTLWPRFLHMVAAIVAVAGLFLAGWGAWRDHAYARRAGLRWFLGATASQALWGTWLLITQPKPLLDLLLNANTAPSLSLWISIACGALALFMAIPASQKGAPAKDVWAPLGLALVSVLGMILLRDQMRDAALAGVGFQATALPHRTDWLSLGIFALTFLGVVVLLVVIFRWAAQPDSSEPGKELS
ncbi:hypothetical protein [Geothrix sp. PMB-07]|uniref:hypothetical protein n=1 Tax=Geothrix sp. PMB-07 TaxID=3068640 RepID=UPI002740BEB8|nr:hypothetical protein [Geothrix sp. PMB-07]WLT31702.1 hypothetical protein Q9293_18520 [Geothrix sp. PMB-07]